MRLRWWSSFAVCPWLWQLQTKCWELVPKMRLRIAVFELKVRYAGFNLIVALLIKCISSKIRAKVFIWEKNCFNWNTFQKNTTRGSSAVDYVLCSYPLRRCCTVICKFSVYLLPVESGHISMVRCKIPQLVLTRRSFTQLYDAAALSSFRRLKNYFMSKLRPVLNRYFWSNLVNLIVLLLVSL